MSTHFDNLEMNQSSRMIRLMVSIQLM